MAKPDVKMEELPERELPGFLKSTRGIMGAMVVLVIGLAVWYQFVGTEDAGWVSSLKSNILSLVSPAEEAAVTPAEKLSTAETGMTLAPGTTLVAQPGWAIRKSAAGDSVWNVYAAMMAGNAAVTLPNQTINGLKNLTILQNNIPIGDIAANSLALGKDYTFLSSASVSNYAKKLAEANKQMAGGTALKDLSNNLQLAYLVANAPSYDFLYSLPSGDLHMLYE